MFSLSTSPVLPHWCGRAAVSVTATEFTDGNILAATLDY